MGTKVNSNYEDLINFVRASSTNNTGAMALRPVSYGDELVANGDMSADPTINGNGVGNYQSADAVSNGRLEINVTVLSSGANARLQPQDSSYIGKLFTVSYELFIPTGFSSVSSQKEEGSTTTTIKTHSERDEWITVTYLYQPTETNDRVFQLAFQNNTSTTQKILVDNLSVKEVLFDQPDGTLTLFPHPENVPRVEYDADGNRLGLLVEEQRTNLVTYSEDFDSWSTAPTAASFELTTALSPSQQNAYLLKDTTNNVEHVTKSPYFSITSGNDYSLSVFVKKQTKSIIRVGAENIGALPARVFFDVDAGQVTTESLGTGSIQDVGNGWYRCIVVGTASSSVTTRMEINVVSTGTTVVYAGDETGLYVYGAQAEAGSFPTSYIKSNSGSTTTRSADVASIPVADFGYNQSAGTFFIDITDVISNNNKDYFSVSSSGSFNPESFGLYGTPDTGPTLGYRRRNSAYNPAITSTADIQSTGSKVALSHDASSLVISVDGVATETSSSNSVDTITEIAFGGSGHGVTGDVHSKHIKSIKYYPRRLTNAQLVELTS